jgi:hypothetical protein
MSVMDFEFPPANILLYMYNPFGPKLTRQVFERIQKHGRPMPFRFLVAFSGLGRQEEGLVTECFRRSGLNILQNVQTLAASRSWILGEIGNAPEGMDE